MSTDFSQKPSPDWLKPTMEESIEYYRIVHSAAVPDDTLTAMKRELCRGDLFYLMVYVLGRKDMLHPWLFDRCREVQREPNGCLDLWAREHRKSSAITLGLTIQDILNYPEITVGIFSHTRPIAKAFLRQIKRELESNIKLKELFPDILWAEAHREAPQWSEDSGIVVKRNSNPKEATIEAWGLVDGQPTGRHFKLRVYDDVVTRESVTTPEQVSKTTEAFDLSDNLGMEGGWCRIIGTRYSLNDSYASILKRGVAKPRLYPATHNGKMDGVPVMFSQEEWERRLKTQSRATVASQLLQNPMADEEAVFKPLWLKAYEVRPRTLNVVILCDPSKGLNANSDNTAVVVLGVSSTGVKYLLDGYCHRMSLSQRWICLRDLYIRWSAEPGVQNIQVGYERYGAQSDDEYFVERQRIENIQFPIEEVSWTREGGAGSQGKRTRIERLEPDFRNGRFQLPLAILNNSKPSTWSVDADPQSKTFQDIIYRDVEGFTKTQLQAIAAGSDDLVAKCIKRVDENKRMYDVTGKFIEGFLYFPFGGHDDILDATSRIYDMDIRPPQLIHAGAGEPRQFFDS